MSKLSDAVGAAFKAITTGSAPILAGDRSGSTSVDIYDPVISRSLIEGMSAGDLYATQPNLRTVVSFVARNGAQLGRHVYSKAANGDRNRVKSSPATKLLARPNEYMTGYDLFNMLLTELALYDFALWVPRMNADGDWMVDPIPSAWVIGTKSANAFQVEKYKIQPTGGTTWYYVEAKDAVVFRGYNAYSFKRGSSTVDSLRDTMIEQVSAMTFRKQMWARGGRVGMFMTRPADAPVWSPEAKAKFVQNWKTTWANTGANAGSTPLLEDGMKLERIGFNAKEEQWLEAANLALATVAAAYHVPPAMVGASGASSTFASVKEFRKMLYTETLGPLIAQVEDTVNAFLLPLINEPAGNYLELNISEKLQGDFEEQAESLFKAVGGPYMVPNEARTRVNLPAIDGGDELLAPLNMGAAGNTNPVAADEPITDPGAEQADPAAPKGQKARGNRAPSHQLDTLQLSLEQFFKRQQTTTLTALGRKAEGLEWWNQKGYNLELAAILLTHMSSMSATVARKAAIDSGVNPDEYSLARTMAFLKAVADSRADLINSTTRDQIQELLDAPDAVPEEAVTHVFTVAKEARAPEVSVTIGTMIAGWASTEMARQLLADKAPTKTWNSSGKANSRHRSMDGQTVGINEKFSNGADWPGDPVLGASGVANCGCGVTINH